MPLAMLLMHALPDAPAAEPLRPGVLHLPGLGQGHGDAELARPRREGLPVLVTLRRHIS